MLDSLTNNIPSLQPILKIPGSLGSAMKSGAIAKGETPVFSAMRIHSHISCLLTAIT